MSVGILQQIFKVMSKSVGADLQIWVRKTEPETWFVDALTIHIILHAYVRVAYLARTH